jgi:hypothetical protein
MPRGTSIGGWSRQEKGPGKFESPIPCFRARTFRFGGQAEFQIPPLPGTPSAATLEESRATPGPAFPVSAAFRKEILYTVAVRHGVPFSCSPHEDLLKSIFTFVSRNATLSRRRFWPKDSLECIGNALPPCISLGTSAMGTVAVPRTHQASLSRLSSMDGGKVPPGPTWPGALLGLRYCMVL